MSQGEMAERTGFLQHYVSDVEGGRSIPSREAFRKVARALASPVGWLFYYGRKTPALLGTVVAMGLDRVLLRRGRMHDGLRGSGGPTS